jgi:hypothetical protein
MPKITFTIDEISTFRNPCLTIGTIVIFLNNICGDCELEIIHND